MSETKLDSNNLFSYDELKHLLLALLSHEILTMRDKDESFGVHHGPTLSKLKGRLDEMKENKTIAGSSENENADN